MGVAPAIDLTADQRRTVLALLRRHLPNTAVWAYGSRVKWTSRPIFRSGFGGIRHAAAGPPHRGVAGSVRGQHPAFRSGPVRVGRRANGLPQAHCDGARSDLRRRDGQHRLSLAKVPIGDVARIVGGAHHPLLIPEISTAKSHGSRPKTSLAFMTDISRVVPGIFQSLALNAVQRDLYRQNQFCSRRAHQLVMFASQRTSSQPIKGSVPSLRINNWHQSSYTTGCSPTGQSWSATLPAPLFKELPAKALAGIKMTLPPKIEQDRVAAVAGCVGRQDRAVPSHGEDADALVRSLFGELCDSDDNWSHRPLADIAQLVRGRSYTSKELERSAETAMVTLKSFERGGGYRPGGLKAFRGPYKVEQAVSPERSSLLVQM